MKFLKILLLLFSAILYGQEFTYIDFGNASTATPGNWNNVIATSLNQEGISVNLITNSGAATGINLLIDDSFDLVNTAGTTSPNAALPFPASSTRDSFFGEAVAFNGNINATGGFTLSGLDVNKFYTFNIFSSRTGVSDNRETQFTVTGVSTEVTALNASNNTSLTTYVMNMKPDAAGKITFKAEKGPNNNNSNGFYYLNALELISTTTPYVIGGGTPELNLVYPNGGHIWEVGKTVKVQWASANITNLDVALSTDGGSTWTSVATAPANQQSYNLVVPNSVTSTAKIKITGETLTDQSDANFSIIPNDNKIFKIVVLGSSTAAGTGPSSPENAWVNKYTKYLTEMDTRYSITNLALGGFATYNILPTGTPIPSGVTRTIDTERNITKAMGLNPGGIIINMPSNDAASGYPVADQLQNYDLITASPAAQNIPVWVTTPQPRGFGTNTTNLAIQLDMVTATNTKFGTKTVDFWTGFGVADGNGILPQYNAGDNIHMNDAAHQILFDRIIGKGIHLIVKDNALLATNESVVKESNDFSVYPNPINNQATIQFNLKNNSNVSVELYNMEGQNLKTIFSKSNISGKHHIDWNATSSKGQKLQPGVYLIVLKTDQKLQTKKVIIK